MFMLDGTTGTLLKLGAGSLGLKGKIIVQIIITAHNKNITILKNSRSQTKYFNEERLSKVSL